MKKNKTNEGLNMDYTTYKKVKGTLDPKASVTITGEKPPVTSTSTTTSSTMREEDSPIVGKTVNLKTLHRMAQQAGNFGEDVKEALISLYYAYEDNVPVSEIKKTLARYDLELKDLKNQDATFRPSAEFAHLFNSSIKEVDSVIEPQDSATIKYLSNVKDGNGKISQPFNIGGKNYQMVRGITPDKKVILGVYCFDDVNEGGENLIHPADYFEETIAKPMREKLEMSVNEEASVSNKPTNQTSLNLGNYKHFIVDESTGKFKKFETIQDLAKYPMSEKEKYMGLSEFKKFFESRVFGERPKSGLNEITPTGQETDVEMTSKAQKLMGLISKRVPSNIIDSIKTNKLAQREVIAAFAELIGVPRTGLTGLVAGIKDLAKQNQVSMNESKRVVKTIKIKDIK